MIFNNDSETEYLILSDKIEGNQPPTFILISTVIVFLFLLSFVIWASLFQVEEVSSSVGLVTPKGDIYKVQHLEGGIIKSTFVKDGQIVNKNDRLIELNSEPAISSLQKAKERAAYLHVHIARLNAFLEGRELTHKEIIDDIDFENFNFDSIKEIAADAIDMLSHQIIAKENEEKLLLSKQRKLQEDLKNLKTQNATASENLKLLEEELNLYKSLEEGSIAKIKMFELQRDFNKSRTLLLETQRIIQNTDASISDVSSQISAFRSEYIKNTLEEIDKLSAELSSTNLSIQKLEDSVKRLVVFSPVYGVIKGLELSANNIVEPGGLILEVVPIDDEMIVEAKVSTADIGHISVGNKVKVKINSYDFAIYGSIDGTISNISASTFVDDEGVSFYKADIVLDKNYLGDNPSDNKIIPGMTASADIITGYRSIMKYLMKPIFRRTQESFRER